MGSEGLGSFVRVGGNSLMPRHFGFEGVVDLGWTLGVGTTGRTGGEGLGIGVAAGLGVGIGVGVGVGLGVGVGVGMGLGVGVAAGLGLGVGAARRGGAVSTGAVMGWPPKIWRKRFRGPMSGCGCACGTGGVVSAGRGVGEG